MKVRVDNLANDKMQKSTRRLPTSFYASLTVFVHSMIPSDFKILAIPIRRCQKDRMSKLSLKHGSVAMKRGPCFVSLKMVHFLHNRRQICKISFDYLFCDCRYFISKNSRSSFLFLTRSLSLSLASIILSKISR